MSGSVVQYLRKGGNEKDASFLGENTLKDYIIESNIILL
jgi:hypothetical protein